MASEPDALGILRDEHTFIEGLLDRLVELAERILAGDRISPGTVRLGVGLLDAYLHRVHALQFDRELWRDAKAVAGGDCTIPLESVRANHARLRQSAREILGLVSRWAGGEPGAQDRVARRLFELASADEAENVFEERHPLACLETVLPRQARSRLGTRFEDHARTKAALADHITRYLHATSGTGTAEQGRGDLRADDLGFPSPTLERMGSK